jgi:molecular chaperone HscB
MQARLCSVAKNPRARMNIDDDDFTLFGLPEHFALDTARLDRRRRELQTEVHPDRFAAQGAAAQRIAMQWSVRVNQAYQRLKDPLQRAAYLCERRGAPVRAERNTAMPRDFLMQQMAWREALDEAHDGTAVQALAAQVAQQQQALLARVEELLDKHNDAAGAAEQLRALMFVHRFGLDIDDRLESLQA